MDLLNQWPRGQVRLDAANGVDYELRSQETGPIDIVLMDLQMPHRDGFQTTRWIRQHQRNTRVLGLSHDPTVANARDLQVPQQETPRSSEVRSASWSKYTGSGQSGSASGGGQPGKSTTPATSQ